MYTDDGDKAVSIAFNQGTAKQKEAKRKIELGRRLRRGKTKKIYKQTRNVVSRFW